MLRFPRFRFLPGRRSSAHRGRWKGRVAPGTRAPRHRVDGLYSWALSPARVGWTRGNLVINLAEQPVGKVKCRVCPLRGVQPLLLITRMLEHMSVPACGGERGVSPSPLPPLFHPQLPLPSNGDEEAKSPTCA